VRDSLAQVDVGEFVTQKLAEILAIARESIDVQHDGAIRPARVADAPLGHRPAGQSPKALGPQQKDAHGPGLRLTHTNDDRASPNFPLRLHPFRHVAQPWFEDELCRWIVQLEAFEFGVLLRSRKLCEREDEEEGDQPS